MENHVLAVLPFSGFYEAHSVNIDDYIAYQFLDIDDSLDNDVTSNLFERLYQAIDHRHVEDEYAKAYVDAINFETKLCFEFESIERPKFYNFSTDRVFVKISKQDLFTIVSHTDKKHLQEIIKENCTSRSGFVSFYDNELEAWGKMSDWDHNQFGLLLQAYLDNIFGEFNFEQEMFLVADFSGSGALDEWLCQTKDGKTNAKVIRISSVAHYLQKRKERVFNGSHHKQLQNKRTAVHS